PAIVPQVRSADAPHHDPDGCIGRRLNARVWPLSERNLPFAFKQCGFHALSPSCLSCLFIVCHLTLPSTPMLNHPLKNSPACVSWGLAIFPLSNGNVRCSGAQGDRMFVEDD